MSTTSTLKTAALTGALLAAMPLQAAAEVTGNIGASSIYLWRGMDLSADNAAISGGLDYGHESGFYAGVWTTSAGLGTSVEEEAPGEYNVISGTEYDLYAGFAGQIGALSYDLSYIDYNYPGNMGADFEEVGVALGLGDFNLSGFFGVGEVGHGDGATDNRDNYYSLDYTYDKITALVGYYDWDDSDNNFTHVDVTYTMTGDFPGAFGFTASKIVDEKTSGTWEDDLKLVVSWGMEF